MRYDARMRLMLVVLAMVSVLSRRAEACSAPSCRASAVVPGNGAMVPANLPGFWWRSGNSFNGAADAGAVTLVNVDGGAQVTLTYTADVFVPEALVAGETYRFDDGFDCYGMTIAGLVTAGPSAALPTTLGVLQLDPLMVGDLQVLTRAGSCSEYITAAQVRATLQPSAEAEPWLGAFLFETLVDGQAWAPSHALVSSAVPGGSWEGRGEDLFYRRCSESTTLWEGLAAGPHHAVLRATLPGTTVTLETAPVSFVLSCDGDAGVSPADGGLVDANPAEGNALERCGCSSGPGAMAALLLLAFRRRA